MNKSRQAGFTLIELVMVVVILSVLAAVALPKLANATGGDDAKQAAVNDIAGSLSSASAINYAGRKSTGESGTAATNKTVPVANCTDVAAALQGGLPAGYAISAATIAADATVSCTLTGLNRKASTFTATGVS